MAMWHDDPNLQGRFHPQYPDDLQVILHEGSFRFTQNKPEIVWGRIGLGLEFRFDNNEVVRAYRAILLNQPVYLRSFKVGQEIMFVAHKDYQHAIYVTQEYIGDRAYYDIIPCDKCGLPELFDPIPKLYNHSFPGVKEQTPAQSLVVFTSFCPMCGGTMGVVQKGVKMPDNWKAPEAKPPAKPAPSTPQDAAPSPQNENLFSKFKKWFGGS